MLATVTFIMPLMLAWVQTYPSRQIQKMGLELMIQNWGEYGLEYPTWLYYVNLFLFLFREEWPALDEVMK